MKYIFSGLFMLLFVNVSWAQNTPVTITGTIFDQNTQQPIEFATIMVLDKASKTTITGTTSGLNGTFELATKAQDFFIEISFIGFNNKTIEDFNIENGSVNLGSVYISENSQDLEEVIVRAEKSQTEFRLDKRVFNVGKDLSSTGASALEVLNNVPSVNVNIEGEISLRGSSGVQILINGKPSVLASEQGNALGTITADMIQQIEVITNPSAKYEAEGTSGIINIVIKKEERKGINGSISVNTGIPDNHSVGLSLNRRTEKFNLFSQLGIGYRELPNDLETLNRDIPLTQSIRSEGVEFRNEVFYNFILGTDYHINKKNVITLSGSYAYEVEQQPSETNFFLSDSMNVLQSSWRRNETTSATNPKYRYELQYKSNLPGHKDHSLLVSALGNFFGKKQSSEFFNTLLTGINTFNDQRTATEFQEGKYTFSVDYTKPFSDKVTIETGALYVINDVSNDFEVSEWENDQWIVDPNLTNVFEYHQNVFGIYGTGAYEDDIWGLKLGLRMENTDLRTLLVNTDEENDQNFSNFFPTVHASYKFSEAVSFQGGYSRRIFRPRLWDLNPFFNIRNNFSIRTGNPNLLPEYTDSYELASIFILGKMSFNLGVYYRHTADMIERISTFEDNVTTTQPFNIGTNDATGVELNFKYSPGKKLSFNGDLNYNYFNRQGDWEGNSFDFQGDQFTSKITSKVKLPAKIDFEITGQYLSRIKTVQGDVSDILFADMGLRKKVLKNKGVLNFSIRDIFASRIREVEINQPGFYYYGSRLRGRFITLGFSYGFGKGEAMEYSGRRRR